MRWSVPDSFGSLSHTSKLKAFPATFCDLISLIRLDLKCSWLYTMSHDERMLPESDMHCCPLSHLPDTFGLLSSLQQLGLTATRLTKLPDSFDGLSSLQQLNMTATQLTSLPDSFGSLRSLQQLVLEATRLTILPPRLSSLSTLELLDLSIAGNSMTFPAISDS